MPLTSWGYGKHGITYTKTAGTLYSGNTSFKNAIDTFLSDSNKANASFNLSGTQNLLSYVSGKWANVQQYYEADHIIFNSSQMTIYSTLYNYFRNFVAPAAIGEDTSGLVITAIDGGEYTTIARFFATGSGELWFDDYIYDAHCAFTYYNAIKYGLFV